MYRKCSHVAEKISEIIDGEADLMTRCRFYTHLMICPKCIKYYNQLKLIKQAAAEPDPDELPADFDDVMNFVMEEVQQKNTKAAGPLKER